MSAATLRSQAALVLTACCILVVHGFVPPGISSGTSRRSGKTATYSSSTLEPQVTEKIDDRVITLSQTAIQHLEELRQKQKTDHLWLRMGVRSGGCSGMSYVLDVMQPADITVEDHLEEYEQHKFTCVVDPKSMLYLFGLKLDYKDALIGGGFQFSNPNSVESCGCGKSFGI